jgi:hypothetical protein
MSFKHENEQILWVIKGKVTFDASYLPNSSYLYSVKVRTDHSSRIIAIATTVGAGVFFSIMLVVLLLKYKRRKMAPMLSTPVHEAVETASESLPIDQVNYSWS